MRSLPRIDCVIEVKKMMDDKKLSTVDILARIRARTSAADVGSLVRAGPETVQGEPTSVAAASVVPINEAKSNAPAEKPTPATSIAIGSTRKADDGPRLSVQEMLKAVRENKGGLAVAPLQSAAVKANASVVAPPMPAKPSTVAKSFKPVPVRRSLAGLTAVLTISATCFVLGFITGSNLLFAAGLFVWAALMTPFAAAWASIAGISGIWTLGTARYMFPNVLVEPPSRFKVGPLSDYPLNTVSNKWKDQFGIWIVHTNQYEGKDVIYALTTICTHLGCTPNWLDGEQKFKCPCHGSGFYITGVNFEGPAPRPLERTGLRIAEDGMLEVNKSVKFQEEMGQWTDPTSFVPVV